MLHGLCSLTFNCGASCLAYGFNEQNNLPISDVHSTAAVQTVGTVRTHNFFASLQCNKWQWPKGHVHPSKRRYTACTCMQQQAQDFQDEEYRSARDIALGIHRRYQDVLNGGFSKNLKEFITACVTAYAVGCTEGGLKKELLSAFQQLEDANEELQAQYPVGLTYKTTIYEVEECILWLSLVFITILCAPQPTIIRWSQTPAVSSEVQSQWQGFCAIIANAYYNRGMAWLPVKVLQLEQIAISGHAEEASLVADRMRLVFATLENISPQWPKR